MTRAKPTAFFSYGRQDAEFSLKLAKDLRAAGIDVWIDQLDIVAGQRWDRAVEQALAASPRLIVVLSPASVASTNVMDEVSFALEEQRNVIPILYKDCNIPFRLRRVQYLDFRKDYINGVKDLLTTLRGEDSSSLAESRAHSARESDRVSLKANSAVPGSAESETHSQGAQQHARVGRSHEAVAPISQPRVPAASRRAELTPDATLVRHSKEGDPESSISAEYAPSGVADDALPSYRGAATQPAFVAPALNARMPEVTFPLQDDAEPIVAPTAESPAASPSTFRATALGIVGLSALAFFVIFIFWSQSRPSNMGGTVNSERPVQGVDPALEHYMLAEKLKVSGSRKEAIAEYREAISLRLGYSDAHYQLGDLLYDDLEAAAAQFKTVIQLEPDNSRGYVKLAEVLRQKNDFMEALHYLQAAAKIHPSSSEVHLALGYTLEATGDLMGALEQYRLCASTESRCAAELTQTQQDHGLRPDVR